jgi:hypothetical protein
LLFARLPSDCAAHRPVRPFCALGACAGLRLRVLPGRPIEAIRKMNFGLSLGSGRLWQILACHAAAPSGTAFFMRRTGP